MWVVLLGPCDSGQGVHTPYRLAGGGGQGEVYLRSPVWWANSTHGGNGAPLVCNLVFPVGGLCSPRDISPPRQSDHSCAWQESSRVLLSESGGRTDCDASATLQAQWPGTSTGGKDIPAALQLRKLGEVLQVGRWDSGCSARHPVPGMRTVCLPVSLGSGLSAP